MQRIHLAVLGAAMCLTTVSYAKEDANTIATFSVNAGEENGQLVIADVALQQDGTLVIEKNLYSRPDLFSGTLASKREIVSKVSDATLQMLKGKLVALASAEIQTTEQKYVCMMMPTFGASRLLKVRSAYDWETQQLSGAFRLVDNNAGCWQKTHIAPKNEHDRATASAFEAALEVLTIEAVQAQ